MKGSKWLMRVSVLATGMVALVLLVAPGAGATPPTREQLPDLPYEFSVDCSVYGFDFELNVQGVAFGWIDTFYDPAGNPVRTMFHNSFTETDTNSETGTTVRVAARTVDTSDLVTGERTVVGEEFRMTRPGRGVVIQDMGRVVFDAPFHISFEAGHHEALHGNLDRLACTALADA